MFKRQSWKKKSLKLAVLPKVKTNKFLFFFFPGSQVPILFTFFIIIIFIVVDFVIHWNETAMGLHVFPIPIPPPTSLSTQSL